MNTTTIDHGLRTMDNRPRTARKTDFIDLTDLVRGHARSERLKNDLTAAFLVLLAAIILWLAGVGLGYLIFTETPRRAVSSVPGHPDELRPPGAPSSSHQPARHSPAAP